MERRNCLSTPILAVQVSKTANGANLLSWLIHSHSLALTHTHSFTHSFTHSLAHTHCMACMRWRSGGAVYAYDLPPSPAGTYRRQTLSTGFKVTEPGPNQAAPGFLTPYKLADVPQFSVLIAGDGSRAAYDLVPAGGGSYNRTTIAEVNGVVGVVGAQTTSAGYLTKAFVADYDGGEIIAFTTHSQ